MNVFGKIVVCLAFFALGMMAKGAEAAATNSVVPAAAATATSATAETGAGLVSQNAPVLFNLGPLPVSNSMVCTWIVTLVIVLIVRATTWKLKEVPTGGQNLMEAIVEGWESLMGNVLEPKVVRWVFPFATTFFLFIWICNLTDLLPGVGSIGYGVADHDSSMPAALKEVTTPLFRPPTTDANLTIAMAGVFFVMSLWWALKYNGPVGLVKHIFGVKVQAAKAVYPLLVLLFLFIGVMETFSILFIRPVALALRLFGNIFAGETMLDMAFAQKSLVVATLCAVPAYFFETVVCTLQAFVFAMLTVAFVGTLCSHADEDHGH